MNGSLTRRVLKGCVALLLISTTPLASAQAQTSSADPSAAAYTPTMTFEVASVRESQVDPATGIRVGGGFQPNTSCHLTLENFTLENLLRMAYAWNLQPKGLPKESWHVFYNIQAHCSDADNAQLATLTGAQRALEQQHMLQSLLADRFALKMHWDSPDSPTYDLVVSKPGRLPSTGAPPSADELKRFGDRPIPPLYQSGSSMNGFEYIAHGATMDMITAMLAAQFGRPVADRTGLIGKYDFRLKYHQTRTEDRHDDETNPWPPLENAIQDQLGLKLVSSHGPVRTLVVEHVEQPSSN